MIILEPTTIAKILAHVAAQLADKKKRERLFAIIGAVIAIPLLLLMMMFYIITAPFNWIRNFFSQDDIYVLEDIRSEHGFPPWGTLEAGMIEGFYCPFPGIDWLVSSPFGMRVNSTTGNVEMHPGIDITWGGAYGTPIGAIADGVVVHAGFSSSAGNWVIIYHGDIGGFSGLISVYMHNSTNHVSVGSFVLAGEIIGTLGNSGATRGSGPGGRSTGHLHLEIRTGASLPWDVDHRSLTALDPLHFIGLPGMRPVPEPPERDIFYEFD